MSEYTGKHVQRTDDGKIFKVHVEDTAGNSLPLDPKDYVNRGINPPIDKLHDLGSNLDSQ